MSKLSEAVDPIFGIPLLEDRAFPKDKAIKTLDDLQDQIADHLVLLFTAPEGSLDVPGWEKELNAWRSRLVRRNRGKKNKKNLSTSDFVTALWAEPFESQADRDFVVAQINKSKGMAIPRIAEEAVQEFKLFVAKYILSIQNDTVFKKTP